MLMPQTTDPQPFKLSGGHAALDLVNTLDNRFRSDGPVELLGDYARLLAFTVQGGLLEPRSARRLAHTPAAAAQSALQAAHELREALAAALYARLEEKPVRPQDLRTLERQFHTAAAHRELRWRPSRRHSGDAEFTWDWGRFEAAPGLPVGLLAQSAAQLLTSSQVDLIRDCGADTCRWLFLDTSRNHTRRWCDMKVCGNRMKARRFHARHEA
jgi:predicted RNA-binding Zn ribbon-like protein